MSTASLLVFSRCLGFAFRAPGFSHPSVPRIVRAALAVSLAIAIVPGVHVQERDGIALIAGLVLEFLLGTAIGIGASLLYDGAYAGGRMLDDYVGVKAMAPSVDLVAPSGFGRLWSIAFTGGYFLLGAYRVTILGFAESFARVGAGVIVPEGAWSHFAMTLASTIVLVAIAVAAPAIALAFISQVALAALSRTIPRFASFTLSFPIVFGVVLMATAALLPIGFAQAGHPILVMPRSK